MTLRAADRHRRSRARSGSRVSRCPTSRRSPGPSRRAARRSAPTRIPARRPVRAAARSGRAPGRGPGARPRTAPPARSPRATRPAPAARAGGFDHRLDVVDLLLQRRRPGDAIRHAAAAPVEQDQPRERREPLVEAREDRQLPVRSRCSTGTSGPARRRADPRRPPGRRSADHRCAHIASAERPPGHTTPGPAVSERTSGPRVEPSPSGGALSGYGRFRCSGTWNGLDPASSSDFSAGPLRECNSVCCSQPRCSWSPPWAPMRRRMSSRWAAGASPMSTQLPSMIRARSPGRRHSAPATRMTHGERSAGRPERGSRTSGPWARSPSRAFRAASRARAWTSTTPVWWSAGRRRATHASSVAASCSPAALRRRCSTATPSRSWTRTARSSSSQPPPRSTTSARSSVRLTGRLSSQARAPAC